MRHRQRPFPPAISEQSCLELASALHLPLTVASLLCQRGISSSEEAQRYLAPKLKELPSPFLLKGMDEGVALIMQALEEQQAVIVFGDYDVDGICATAIMVDFLSSIHLDVTHHIPNRLTEGYGLSGNAIQQLAGKLKPGQKALLVTVDNGISAIDEIAEARKLGFHVLLTDHHQPPESLPEADALINPKQKECTFPFKELSGAGVAFYLIAALRSTLAEKGFWDGHESPNLKAYLDLVALGTVADVMPMVGVNRILVRAGLEVLSERKRPGLWALCEQIGLREGDVSSEDISYRIGPRINACGRLGSPETAAKLLLCKDVEHALDLARELEEKNIKRREIEAEILPEAIAQGEGQVQEGLGAVVVYDGAWHPGVIGIVAAKISERFQRPAIALTDDGVHQGLIKGSGRTVDGIDLYTAVKECRTILEKFGGHTKAIGLSLQKEKLGEFVKQFSAQVEQQLQGQENGSQEILFDHLITRPEEVDPEILALLPKFEPFGEKNPEPVFLLKNVQLVQVALVKEEHLKFSLALNGRTYRGIAFGMGNLLLAAQKKVHLTFKIKHSVYRGRRRVEIMAINIIAT